MTPGPELDRRVAEAMGWYTGYDGPKAIMCRLTGDRSRATLHELGRYSTDAARIPELLAWLFQAIGPSSILTLDGDPADSSWCACVTRYQFGTSRIADVEGTTLQHALSLLVVAVAEAKP